MKIRFINFAILFAAVFCFSTFSALAQESEAVVVDEVVAQVNDNVITLSGLKKEIQEQTDALVKSGKTPEQASAEVEKTKGELIAGLIDEELIMQKGKELNFDSDVEAQINQRFLQIMKEQNLKTVDQLYKAMSDQGIKPDEIRNLWRKQIMRDMVLRQEVYRKAYYLPNDKDVQTYFNTHKDKFTKPETVTLSELFLGFAGRDMPTVEAKADDLIKQAKSGADFAKLVTENSERPDAAQTKGSVGTLPITELNPQVAEAIKGAKTGDIVKLKVDEGIEVIKIDNRAAASSETEFNEETVRSALASENYPAEQKKYIAGLRKDAYIQVSDSYSALVAPLLKDSIAATEKKTASK